MAENFHLDLSLIPFVVFIICQFFSVVQGSHTSKKSKNNLSLKFVVSARKPVSNDELSKDKGGNIGWITSKDLSGELSNSIFSIANIGDVSKILETEQGFYIFKLIDIKDSKIKKFNDIKNNLRKDYKNIQISAGFFY